MLWGSCGCQQRGPRGRRDQVRPRPVASACIVSASVCSGHHNRAPQMRRLNNRHLFSHSFGGRNPKIKVRARFILPGAFLLGWRMAVFLL